MDLRAVKKRFVGALVGSESPYEADMVGAKLIDMKPEEILVLKKRTGARTLWGKAFGDQSAW